MNSKPDSDVPPIDLTVLAQVAEQRREQESSTIQRGLPDFIESVVHAEVVYTVEPLSLPFSHLDIPQLVDILEKRYSLTAAPCDAGPLLANNRVSLSELSSMTNEQIMQAVLREDEGLVEFVNGRFPTERNQFVPIKKVRLRVPESVASSVSGVGEVAELLTKEIIEILWACAGAPKRWEQVEPNLVAVGYSTGTMVKLESFEELLNRAVIQYMDDKFLSGPNYAAHTAYYLRNDGFGPPRRAVTSWALDAIALKVFRFDQRTGRQDEMMLQFDVMGRGDYRSGKVRVVSELPFAKHLEALGELVTALREQSSG